MRNLRFFNKALIGKWLWRYYVERYSLWENVVHVKYGTVLGAALEGGWYFNEEDSVWGEFVEERLDWLGEFINDFELNVGDVTMILFGMKFGVGIQLLSCFPFTF